MTKLDFAQLGLRPVARMENYRGFVFASFDANITDLVTYLAGAREYLDLVIDSGDGQMEIVKGTNEYCIQANWKLLAENSIDGYHAVSTHDTYFKYLCRTRHRPQGRCPGHREGPGQRSRRAGVRRALGPADRQVGAAVR